MPELTEDEKKLNNVKKLVQLNSKKLPGSKPLADAKKEEFCISYMYSTIHTGNFVKSYQEVYAPNSPLDIRLISRATALFNSPDVLARIGFLQRNMSLSMVHIEGQLAFCAHQNMDMRAKVRAIEIVMKMAGRLDNVKSKTDLASMSLSDIRAQKQALLQDIRQLERQDIGGVEQQIIDAELLNVEPVNLTDNEEKK